MRTGNPLTLAIITFSILALAACSQQPAKTLETASIPQAPESNVVYRLPGVAFSQYTNIVFTPLNTDNVKIIAPVDTSMRRQEWALNPQDIQRMQKMFAESVNQEIVKDGRFSNDPQQKQNTLMIDSELLSLFPSAPKDDLKSRPPRTKYYTDGAGSMTVMFTARDARTGQMLARFMETNVDSGRKLNNRISNQVALQQAFRRWGFNIREGLIKLAEPNPTP